jgi:hypothetical protein
MVGALVPLDPDYNGDTEAMDALVPILLRTAKVSIERIEKDASKLQKI